MVICKACGARAADGVDFCGECGAYLEWEGERLDPVVEAGPAAPEPQTRPEPAPAGFVERLKAVVVPLERAASETGAAPRETGAPDAGTRQTAARLAGASGAAAAPPTPPTTVRPEPRPGRDGEPERGAPDQGLELLRPPPEPRQPPEPPVAAAPRQPAAPIETAAPRRTTVPRETAASPDMAQPPPGPQPRQPGAVRPGAPRPPVRRAQPTGEDERPAPGEQVCGSCGAGNVATRRFCRRCGHDLVDAAVVARRSWWRRLLRPDAKPAAVAGTRPRATGHRRWGRLVLALLLVVLAGTAWAARGTVRDLARRAHDGILDRVQTEPVNPVSFAASSSAPGHGPKLLRDDIPNRFWAPADARSGSWAELRFAEPFRLVYLEVYNGVAADPAAYLRQGRARVLVIAPNGKGARAKPVSWPLQDKSGVQRLNLVASQVTSVRITVVSAYGLQPGHLLGLGEVRVFGRR